MAWYAYYIDATGRLHSVGESDIIPPGGMSKVYVGETRPTGVWNTTTHQFDPRPPVRKMSLAGWLDRFTGAELKAVLAVNYDIIDPDIIAFQRFLMMGIDVDLDDQIITTGMTELVAAGLITLQRSTEILADV